MSDGRMIDATTQVCAVWGNPVEHSLSPAIHNAAFVECDLNYVYVGFRVEDVGAAVTGFRALHNFRGLSVTIPHKVSIMPHLDRVDPIARHVGSVNTVVKEDGLLRGTSTDGPAAVAALRDEGVDPAGRPVLILGSGGAARAIGFASRCSSGRRAWPFSALWTKSCTGSRRICVRGPPPRCMRRS